MSYCFASDSAAAYSSSEADSKMEGNRISNLFIYLFAHKTLHKMYCHVQREQDNKAQITGTNSCPLRLNHTATDRAYNAMHLAFQKLCKIYIYYGTFKTC